MNEGDKREIVQEYRRKECEQCGEPATHNLTFLLPNARRNPASSGYGKDDISWCSDKSMLVCDECVKSRYKIANELRMEWCADYPKNDSFEHMFYAWETVETKDIDKRDE